MIYRSILEKNQVQQVADALLAKKLKEKAAEMCEQEHICARNMTYRALNPDKYDGTNVIHRNVLDAAVRLLNIHGVNFSWESLFLPTSQEA